MQFSFFTTAPPPTEIYTLSLHDALPISGPRGGLGNPLHRVDRPVQEHFLRERVRFHLPQGAHVQHPQARSEEHTSELQSHSDLVCRLLLEKKKEHAACTCISCVYFAYLA